MKTLTVEEAAKFLATDPSTVRALIEDAALPAAKIGRAWVMLEDDLAEYLRSRIREQTAERMERRAAGMIVRQKTEASRTSSRRRRNLPQLPDLPIAA